MPEPNHALAVPGGGVSSVRHQIFINSTEPATETSGCHVACLRCSGRVQQIIPAQNRNDYYCSRREKVSASNKLDSRRPDIRAPTCRRERGHPARLECMSAKKRGDKFKLERSGSFEACSEHALAGRDARVPGFKLNLRARIRPAPPSGRGHARAARSTPRAPRRAAARGMHRSRSRPALPQLRPDAARPH